MNSYHFSLGNSTDGPVGYCARITAKSKEAALLKLQEILEAMNYESGELHSTSDEYLQVYFNAGAISTNDIDEWNDLEQ